MIKGDMCRSAATTAERYTVYTIFLSEKEVWAFIIVNGTVSSKVINIFAINGIDGSFILVYLVIIIGI